MGGVNCCEKEIKNEVDKEPPQNRELKLALIQEQNFLPNGISPETSFHLMNTDAEQLIIVDDLSKPTKIKKPPKKVGVDDFSFVKVSYKNLTLTFRKLEKAALERYS